MIIFDRTQTPGIPATDEGTRRGGPGATILAGIACLLALPWVLLPGAGAMALFVFAVSPPFAPMRMLVSLILAFPMFFLCVRWARWPYRLLTQPSYASSVPPMLMLLFFYLLLSIALPNFTRVSKGHVAAAVGSTESIRAALASYAAKNSRHSFPAEIANWEALRALVNANGGSLGASERERFSFGRYTALDTNGDDLYDTYTMSFHVPDWSDEEAERPGALILVSPSGVEKRGILPERNYWIRVLSGEFKRKSGG